MSKHTPGPWKKVFVINNFEVQNASGKCVADAWSYDIDEDQDQMVANANLIAAAPDLLESLEYLMAIIAQQGDERYLTISLTPEYFDAARKAIARAKGESS